MNYIPTKVNIVAGQKEKLKKALEEKKIDKFAMFFYSCDNKQYDRGNSSIKEAYFVNIDLSISVQL